MTCTGLPAMTCTHAWDATTCFEGLAGSEIGMRSCDLSGGGKTRGTAARTATGEVVCTTTTGNAASGSVLLTSWAVGTVDVPVLITHTNGTGSFQGSRMLFDRTIYVEGTFATVGYDPHPCGIATSGSMNGYFTVTTP